MSRTVHRPLVTTVLSLAALTVSLTASTAAFAQDGFFFDEGDDTLYSFVTDGSEAPTAIYDGTTASAHGRVFGIDTDTTNGHIYWGEGWTWDAPVELHRADLDGSNHVVLRDDLRSLGHNIARQLELDVEDGYLYFSDDSNIVRTDLDGSNLVVIVSGLRGGSFDLDADNDVIYYSNRGLFSYDITSATTTELVPYDSSTFLATRIELDATNGYVYYSNARNGGAATLWRSTLDGSTQEKVAYMGDNINQRVQYDPDSNKIYYATSTAYREGDIRSIDLDAGALPLDYPTGHEVVVPGRNKVTYFDLIAGASTGPVDTDGDGFDDDVDNCPLDANADQADADGDGEGDVCDVCYGTNATEDYDQDGYCTDEDNCPVDTNADQADADGDGIGDACEADTDEDGVIDDDDNCPADANPDQADSELDGLGDVCDDDDDNDGVTDDSDNCPLFENADQADYDGDGQGDVCDGDDDADGVLDEDDQCPGTPLDVLYDAETGCSGVQLVELAAGSCDDAQYKNSGQYVKAVAHAATEARDAGLLSGKERGAIVSAAAKSCR